MIACGVFSTVLLVLIAMFVRNRQGLGAGDDEHWPRPREIARLLVSWPILSRAVAGGLVASAGVAFGMLWGVSYFQSYHHLSLSAASVVASFYFWGCLPGMLGSAWLCARYRAPARLLALGAVGSAAAMALILFALQGQIALGAAMFVLGVCNSSYVLSFTMVRDKAPTELSGVAMGLTNMLIMGIGGLIFQPLIGVLAHAQGQGVPGATALSITIVAPLLALVVLAAIGLDRPRGRGRAAAG